MLRIPELRTQFICLAVTLTLTAFCGDLVAADRPAAGQAHTFKSDTVKDLVANRQALAKDPYRPLYHFSPPGFGTHDPAGLCWWKGKYHFFYLFSVPGVLWGRGHAVSDDLVHWRDLPMLPKSIRGGTGQVWVDKDKDRVILGVAGAKIATASDPMLLKWTEHPVKTGGDNFIWREGEYYYLTRTRHGRNTALEILRSRDLKKWESMGNYIDDGNFTDPRTDCSCNNILAIGKGKHLVLFFSHNQGPKYYIGTSDMTKCRFTIEKHGRMTYGTVMRGALHAPSGFVDPKGRCIGMWNIMECVVSDNFRGTKNGVISLPRRLFLSDKPTGRGFDRRELNPLGIEPIAELKKLRFNPVKVAGMDIPANEEKVLPGVKGRAMEIEAVIDPGKASQVGLRVLRSADGREQTSVSLFMHAWAWPWRSDRRELMLDVSRASLSPAVAARTPEIGPLYLKDGKPLRLRIFIDRSIVEVFANGRQCLTLRAYPTLKDSTGVSVFARGGKAKLVSLVAHQMKSIWPELKSQEGR